MESFAIPRVAISLQTDAMPEPVVVAYLDVGGGNNTTDFVKALVEVFMAADLTATVTATSALESLDPRVRKE